MTRLSSVTGVHRNPGRDDGLTLVELVIAMFVTSILLAGVGTVFVGTLRSVRTVNTKASTGADARLAIEAMSRTLKVAAIPYGSTSAFLSDTSTGMSFYALLNRTGANSTTEPVTSLVSYSYASNCLTESITQGTVIANPALTGPFFSWPSSATKTKCLLRTSTAPEFHYFDGGALTATELATGLTLPSDLAGILSVSLHLVATQPGSGISGVPVDSRITLENLLPVNGS